MSEILLLPNISGLLYVGLFASIIHALKNFELRTLMSILTNDLFSTERKRPRIE